MNDTIIKQISAEINIDEKNVMTVLKLLQDGNTVPFIARYRKNLTGALDEDQIRKINDFYTYEENLLKRKEDVIRLIDEKGLLTSELRMAIMKANKLIEVEDLYRPYKEKKKTKATIAIAKGLEPLAKLLLTFPTTGNITLLCKAYIGNNLTEEEAINGAKDIIAEMVSDNATYRKWIRHYFESNGIISSTKKAKAIDTAKIYEMYYSYEELVKWIKPHRILALNRGEKEKILTVNIKVDKTIVLNYLVEREIKNDKSFTAKYVKEALEDSYKRLLEPTIEREIRNSLTEIGEQAAIENFSKNLENLLLTPPIKDKVILAFDPGFVNGCKLAVIDKFGKYLASTVIYPFSQVREANNTMLDLIKKYDVAIIAIGNGTASRESEKFCADLINSNNLSCKYVIVSEAGASIYSASPLAKMEFPDLAIEKRSAVSIGRRLEDPLAELVKIPPSGIGVGLYQHDVSPKNLEESLSFTVLKCVNSVGVNINTASTALLSYVSGLTKTAIEKIINYRNLKGEIASRLELKKEHILTPKVYEQAIGFLRIPTATNVLDKTAIHPESYALALGVLKELNLSLDDIGTKSLIDKLNSLDIPTLASKLSCDIYTLKDVLVSLQKPNLDPRDEYPQPILKSNILQLEDLTIGMKLQGTVRNVVDFGAFIDIGLHNDGLAHISKLANHYIKHPSEVVSVGDIVDCYVDDISLEKKKVSLSLLPR